MEQLLSGSYASTDVQDDLASIFAFRVKSNFMTDFAIHQCHPPARVMRRRQPTSCAACRSS
jgi:hypothetical protein